MNTIRYLALVSFLYLLLGCSCPDAEFKAYTAHVFIKNTLDEDISLNLRVEYRQDVLSLEYRYANEALEAKEDKVITIETGSYAVWEEGGHSDCQPKSPNDQSNYGHYAEFSADTVSKYTICVSRPTPGRKYEIYKFGNNCPEDMTLVDNGWS